MDRAQIRAFRQRWLAVNDFELREQRKLTAEKKMRQLSALMHMASQLGWKLTAHPQEIEQVRNTWNRLRDKLVHGNPRVL